MGSRDLIAEVLGKVVGLSHIFRLNIGPLFLIELQSDDTTHFILVRKKEQFSWHEYIFPGSYYSISNLRENIIYERTHNITTLIASHKSTLSLLRREQCEFNTVLDSIEDLPSFINFKSKVTSIVNEEVGIYKLEGDVVLTVSYLKEVAVEWTAGSPPLSVGEELRVFNGHPMKGKDGTLTLLCCGRTLVRRGNGVQNEAALHEKLDITNAILHCLYIFNLGIDFLRWLLEIQNFLIENVLGVQDPYDMVTTRNWKGERGMLCKFVLESLKDYKLEPRSFLLEFLLRDHCCVISQDFQGCSPLKINEISNFVRTQKIEGETVSTDDLNSLWNYSLIGKREHNFVLFGVLKLTDHGTLKIEAKDQCINVEIVGSATELFSIIGSRVAALNFDYIEEKYNIYELEEITRKYLVLRSNDLINLSSKSHEEVPPLIRNGTKTFTLKLTSLSAFQIRPSDLKKEVLNGFFVAYTQVFQKDEKGEEKCWQKLIKFDGSFSKLYPLLTEPCEIRGKICARPSDTYFLKSSLFSWLTPMKGTFSMNEIVEIPPQFEIDSIDTILLPTSTDSIPEILEGTSLISNMLSINGTIIRVRFMTPKFESQVVEAPVKFLQEGIGVPGSKVTMLLIQDKKDPGFSVWVYFSSTTKKIMSKYTLGLIPGAEVHVTFLERFQSKSNSVYLSSTPFSRVYLLSSSSRTVNLPTKRLFIKELIDLPSGIVCLLFATINLVVNLHLKNICPSCESDFERGRCTYVGCHANKPSVVVGRSKVVVDDGSSTAALFIKDVEHIKVLLNVNESQWNTLTKALYDTPLTYRYRRSEDKSEVGSIQTAFNDLVNDPQNFRPLKIVGRIFPNKDSYFASNVNLFAVTLTPINYVLDTACLEKTN